MNVNLNTISNNSIFFLRENVLPTFTIQQKKIILFALGASAFFACLAASYLICSKYFFKGGKKIDGFTPYKIMDLANEHFKNDPQKDKILRVIGRSLPEKEEEVKKLEINGYEGWIILDPNREAIGDIAPNMKKFFEKIEIPLSIIYLK